MRSCPKCTSGDVITERRPDGNSKCCVCSFYDKTTIFDLAPEKQRLVLAHDDIDLTYSAIAELYGSQGVEMVKRRVKEIKAAR